MTPIGELRGAIPYALSQGIDPFKIFFIAVIFNTIIIIPTWFFLDYIHKYMIKVKIYEKLFNYYIKRIIKKIQAKNYKWKYIMLLMFVAIPLPGTGAYTGSLVAWLFDLDRKKSMATIYLAIIIAAIIVIFASLGAIMGYNSLI